MTGRRFARCIAGALHVLLLCIVLACVRAHDSTEFSREKMLRYRERVRAMFYHAYNGYLEYAYPFDELQPLSCKGFDTWGSFSLTLVDALDTLVLLGNGTEFERASRLVLKSIDFDANVNVSVFETNIREPRLVSDSNLTMEGNDTEEWTGRKSTVATVPKSGTEVEIEYEIDEKYLAAADEEDLKEDGTDSQGEQSSTPSPTSRKLLSVEDEDSDEEDGEDQSEATTSEDGRSANVKLADERTLQLAENVANLSVRVKQTETNQKQAQPTRDKSGGHEEKSIKSESHVKSMSAREDFANFLKRVVPTKHSPPSVDQKCTLRPMSTTGGGADVNSLSADALAKALRDVLEAALKPTGTSVDQFLRSVEHYLVGKHALAAASHRYSVDAEEGTVCRPYDVVTSSRLFASFLHLVYDRRPSIRSLLRHPACLASAPAAEEDDYDRSLPRVGGGTGEEESGAGGDIPLSADLRHFKTRELAELQFELMSCARRPFATARLSRMGEIVR